MKLSNKPNISLKLILNMRGIFIYTLQVHRDKRLIYKADKHPTYIIVYKWNPNIWLDTDSVTQDENWSMVGRVDTNRELHPHLSVEDSKLMDKLILKAIVTGDETL